MDLITKQINLTKVYLNHSKFIFLLFLIFEITFLGLSSANALLIIKFFTSTQLGFISINNIYISSQLLLILIIIISLLSIVIGFFSYRFQNLLISIAKNKNLIKKPIIIKMLISSISSIPIILVILVIIGLINFQLLLILSIFLFFSLKLFSIKYVKNWIQNLFYIDKSALPMFALSKKNQVKSIFLMFIGMMIILFFLNENLISLSQSILAIIFFRFCTLKLLEMSLINDFYEIKKNKSLIDIY